MPQSGAGSDFDPSKVNSTAFVMEHIAIKGVQAGSILGIALAIPITAFKHKARGGTLDLTFLLRAQKALTSTASWTTILSCLSGVGVLGLKEGWDKDKIEDRAYRLYYSQGQNRVDRLSVYGAAGGSIVSLLSGARSLRGIGSGLLVGVAAGTIYHVVSSSSSTESQLKSVESSAAKVAEELKR